MHEKFSLNVAVLFSEKFDEMMTLLLGKHSFRNNSGEK